MKVFIADGQIQDVRGIVNPDRLRHLGPVSDLLPTPLSPGVVVRS